MGVWVTRDEALEVLGITDASHWLFAYRTLSKACHPNGQTPNMPLWNRLSEARAVLLAPPPRCTACKGTGRVRAGLIAKFCDECRGKGHA